MSSVIRIITTLTKDVNDVEGAWKIQMETNPVVIKMVRVCLDVITVIGDSTVIMNAHSSALIKHVILMMVAAQKDAKSILLADVGKPSNCTINTLNSLVSRNCSTLRLV